MRLITLITTAFFAIALVFSPADAAKKKVKKVKPAVSSYDKAKKICLQDNPYIEGKLLQACIKKKEASLKKE